MVQLDVRALAHCDVTPVAATQLKGLVWHTLKYLITFGLAKENVDKSVLALTIGMRTCVL
jgi:hypothetical protein